MHFQAAAMFTNACFMVFRLPNGIRPRQPENRTRRLARNVRTALFGRDKLHFAALDFQAADIAREQVAGYIAFGAA